MLYNCLFKPMITFGIEAWYGASQTSRNRIFVLQKKALRAINNLPYNSHTHQSFCNMRILKLNECYRLNILVHLFKFRKTSPVSLNSDVHSHNTRGRNQVLVPFYKKSRSQSSWLYQAILEWNRLPGSVKSNINFEKFKKEVLKYLFESYDQ